MVVVVAVAVAVMMVVAVAKPVVAVVVVVMVVVVVVVVVAVAVAAVTMIVVLCAGVMASRDANIAQITVEAVWRSVCQTAADHKGGTPLDPLRSALSQCFEQQPRQAGYVQCLQSLALADRGGCVSVKLAAAAAQASGRLQAGALQIEEQMLFGAEAEASGPKSKRRAVGNRTPGSSTGGSHPMEPSRRADAPSWGALAEVYAQLGQEDLMQVIYSKCLSR